VALVVLLKIAFYWLNASAYRQHGQDEGHQPQGAWNCASAYKDKPRADAAGDDGASTARRRSTRSAAACPIFVQMPFFIALYWVLLSSVEMRDAPWIGWIHDLSTKDPLVHPAAADDGLRPCSRPG